jgi:cation transport protein ChaC
LLTRESISSGEYLECFGALPKEILWSKERIANSLRDTLLARPEQSDVWLFAYGSLIWNPLVNVRESQPAKLQGWRRSFCLRTTAGRATTNTPGRMLSLEPGGETHGLALRLAETDVDEELHLVWIREMLTGAYRPTWARLSLGNRREIPAIVFVADPAHPHYENDASVKSVAPLVAAASGPLGTNVDYVLRLEKALAEHQMADSYVDELAGALRQIRDVLATSMSA